MYNPIIDQAVMIPNFQSGTNHVLWDIENPNLFVTVDSEKMCSYVYIPLSLEGIQIVHLPEYLKLDEIET